MMNSCGELTEATRANLAVRLGDRWYTPPVGSGCLPGIERARLLDAGQLHERVLTVDDLTGAAGTVLLSSLRGWRPTQLVDAADAAAAAPTGQLADTGPPV